jgi:hypothetical protein
MRNRRPISLLLSAASAAFLAATAPAQVSEYFLMAGDQSMFHVIRGGVLLRSWSPAPGTAQYQYPIVVTSTIRTMGANVGEVGAAYGPAGADLGPRYTHPAGPQRSWDGATDGLANYSIDTAGGVYRFNRDWTNPVLLFDAGGIGSLTYDPTNQSLWVSQFSTTTIVNYTLAGAVISMFSTGHSQNMALALDHADGTLWLHDRTTQGTFEQWSKTGTLLNRIAVAGMSSQNALGGEMQFPNAASCTFRNGNGINPADFACVTPPAVGATWTTSYNSSANTLATILLIGTGPATGPPFGNGEVLITLAPPPITIIGTGNISIPLAADRSIVGTSVSTQGARIDNPGPVLLLLNAQDVVLGY